MIPLRAALIGAILAGQVLSGPGTARAEPPLSGPAAPIAPVESRSGSGQGAWPAFPRDSGFPYDAEVYRGRGYADKRVHPHEYRERARAAALAEIAREIAVTIRTETRSAKREGAAGWREEWSDSVRLEAAAELSGYRLARRRETAEGYWVEYALDKREYARARAAAAARFTAWLDAGAADLESLLRERRLQAAWDRCIALRDSLDRRPGHTPESMDAWNRFRLAAAEIGKAVREARWETTGAWIHGEPWPGRKLPERPSLSLFDGEGGAWLGPWRIAIVPGPSPGPVLEGSACTIWTDAEGRVDPGEAMEGCGLPPGRWSIRWPVAIRQGNAPPSGPEQGADGSAAVRAVAAVEAAWLSLPVRMAVSCASAMEGCGPKSLWLESLRAGLAVRCGPRYRASEDPAAPALEIRITAEEADSLEGMHFAIVRAELRLPGLPPRRLAGKGGHAEREKARARAREDFLDEAGRMLGAPWPRALP